jgi:hypothetical protein
MYPCGTAFIQEVRASESIFIAELSLVAHHTCPHSFVAVDKWSAAVAMVLDSLSTKANLTMCACERAGVANVRSCTLQDTSHFTFQSQRICTSKCMPTKLGNALIQASALPCYVLSRILFDTTNYKKVLKLDLVAPTFLCCKATSRLGRRPVGGSGVQGPIKRTCSFCPPARS